MGEERTYTVLNTLEFNSSRKRMSAIIRMPDGTIRLFCKGADSIIYSRLARGKQQDLRRKTAEHLEEYAKEGLRTLCIADRLLSEEEYQAWNREHDVAAAAIEMREEKLEKVSSQIEQELMLLGGTAIEDRLQDGVPDTIQLLADAGIKLWVLTGDKVETAINIGFSCNLLNNDMDLIVLNVAEGQFDQASADLDKHLQTFGLTGSDEELIAARADHTPPEATHAVIVDGETLKLMLNDELKQKFLLLCKQCKAVLCCRVSPSQKAAVVNMVRHGLDIMALSIGDGANDVAMIQEADVGVGIAGEEGRQAVMSSDYAIGQFRFLQRLLLVHGRWSYRRLGECTANFFYKNLVWTFALFWYCVYNDFDGSYLFDYTYIVLVNLAFTSLPVIFMGIFDQDVDDKISLAVPQLYMRGIERKEWSQLKFWLYMADGLYQSVICFFMPYQLYQAANFATASGRDIADRTRMGVLIASCAVLASNIYVMMNTYRWDWFTVLINAISCLLIFFWTGIYSCFTASGQFYNSAYEVYGSLSFWVVLLITTMISLLPRFTYNAIQKVFFPLDVDIIREQVTLGKFKYLDDVDDVLSPKGEAGIAASTDESAASSELAKPIQPQLKQDSGIPDDERPFYPPATVHQNGHNPRSQNGSNGTNYTASLDQNPRPQSVDYVRRSHDRTRHSFERVRQSFEQSNDFTSAAMLQRMESSHGNEIVQDPFRAPGEPPAHNVI
jgi:phospholipid-translocating ATPase